MRFWWMWGVVCLLISIDARGADFECMLEPTRSVELGSPTVAVVKRLHVNRGDRVRKGQLLVELEADAELSAMEAARLRANASGDIQRTDNRVKFLRQKHDRLRRLATQRLIPRQEADDAEAELRVAEGEARSAHESRNVARSEYRQQKGIVAQRMIRSPFNGVVVDRALSEGDVTESSGKKKAILKVAMIDPLRVHVVLPDTRFGELVTGEMVTVTPLYRNAPKLRARVTQVDRVIDAASGTFSVFMQVPNPDHAVPAGMRCKVSI